MGDVVEHRGEDERGPEPGSEVEPARPNEPVDAEQLRQFRQFQQFQEFQRLQSYQEAQQRGEAEDRSPLAAPPRELEHAAPPRRRLPRWARWLLKKVVSWLIFLVLLGLGLLWAYNYFIANDEPEQPAAEMGGGTYRTNKILATEPYEAVRKVYAHVAQGRPDLACGYFDNERGIQQRFATDTGHRDCRAAVLALHEKVTNVNTYAESIYPRRYEPQATTIRIESCDFPIEGGPALGTFVVTKQSFEGQWLITGHEAGPKTCPTSSPTTR